MPARRILAGAALAALLGACEALPPPQPVTLPPEARPAGGGDPLRGAALAAAIALGSPATLAGRPADAARAIGRMEYLAAALPDSPLTSREIPTLGPQLQAGRREWRGALGIPAAVPPQAVIDALFGAAVALDTGRRDAAVAALAPPLFPEGGEATLARLAALPRLPRTNAAAVAAQQSLRTPRLRGRAL